MRFKHITTIALLTATILLGGCSKNHNNSVPETDTSSVIVFSSDSLQAESLSDNESSITGSLVQSNDESIVLTPVEFTDEDKELQNILSELLNPAEEILSWFVEMALPTPMIYIDFPQYENIPSGGFALVPENYFHNGSYSLFEMPTTRDGMREIMLKYFSEEYTENRVGDIVSGTLTENPDGTYSMTVTDEIDTSLELIYEKFVEADGRLYQRDGIKIAGINMDYSTAKIVSKTDDTIEFTYLLNSYSYKPKPEYKNEPLYSENAFKGVLKYERGGWKFDSWGFE